MSNRLRRGVETLNALRKSVAVVSGPSNPGNTGPPVVRQDVYRNTVFEDTVTDYLLKQAKDQYRNDVSFTCTPFFGFGDSGMLLGHNPRRCVLMVDNQSSNKDLYVNFGANAGVNIGVLVLPRGRLVLDNICPNNAVYLYFDDTANQPAVLTEGSPIHRHDE